MFSYLIRWASDDDFIFLDIDNEIEEKDISDVFIPPELSQNKLPMSNFFDSIYHTSKLLAFHQYQIYENWFRKELIMDFLNQIEHLWTDHKKLVICFIIVLVIALIL